VAEYLILSFEGSMGDKRDIDEGKTLERIDTFIDLLGVRRLTK
jgi:hypothetical protein